MTKLDWVVTAVIFFILIGDTVIDWIKDLIRETKR